MGRRPRATLRRGASWPDASRKGAVCSPHVAQNALFRYIAAREAWGATPRQPAGHYEKWPNWANALGQPPARLRGGLRQGPQASAWPDASRKGAVCSPHVTQNAPFRHVAAREAWGATPRQPAGHYGKWPNWANASGQPPARLRGGSARVRKPRPEVRHLTEKRSLGRGPR